jgi:PAS domain S-box-containing protein
MDDVTELKKVEKELKKHEAIQTISQRLQTIIDKIEDGITLSDTKGKFELFNSRMQEITGYTMEEANRSSNFTTLLYPDVQEQKKALDTINETTKKGFSRNIETKIQAKDGTKKTLLVSTSLQNFDNRDMFLSVYRDITERKKAEEILKESESKHRTLLRNLPQEIFYKDKNSVYISCNESYASDLKIKPEDIPGKTDYDFFPKNLAEKYRDDDKRVLESGVTKDIEEFYTKDGKTLWVHTVKSPVKDTNGNIMGVLGIFWDITEQKTMQEAIKQSEERYRAIFESANDGIITMSKDGKINDINAIASTLFGYRREEFIGKNLKEIMHIFTLKSKMTILKNFALRILGKEIAPYDVEMIKADGSILNVEINAVPLRKDGAIVGDLAILHDVTDRKKAEDELKRKIEELERYKNVTVGRELTMVELKKEINELCEKLGEKPRYSLNRETL